MNSEKDFLSESAKKLKRNQPTDELWKKIETKLVNEKKSEKSVSGFNRFSDSIWGFISGENFAPKLGFASILVVTLIGISIFYLNPKSEEKPNQEAQIDLELQNARMDYQRSISELENFVVANKENINPRIYSVQKEKLSFIDESIKECERALSKNELNVRVQKFLKQSLDQKLSTLKELVKSVKEPKKNEKS